MAAVRFRLPKIRLHTVTAVQATRYSPGSPSEKPTIERQVKVSKLL